MLGRVRFATDFFKKERNQAYSDWESAFWRELFQNSVDQDVTQIQIGLHAGDGCVVVNFADNGPGMTREVLQDVYFAIGATTKTGNQIGGMGRARVLTCFAMKSYQIRSQDYLVIGQGGEYEVKDAPFGRGCELTIEVDDTSLDTMRDKLQSFLRESRISARVTLNGEVVTDKAPLNGKAARTLVQNDRTFAQVYVNRSASKRLIVRVNGVSMYTKSTNAKAQVVVEIEPDISRHVLTSNRDGMHWRYEEVLDRFLRELAVDTNSALRPRFARRTTVTNGGGLKQVQIKKPQPKTPKPEANWEGTTQANTNAPTTSGAMLPLDSRDTYEEARLPKVDFSRWLAATFGNIYIYDETNNPLMHKSVAGYLPENWNIRTICPNRRFRSGGNFVRLLLVWKTAIEYTLEVALPIFEKEQIKFGVGFLFADDRLAEHKTWDEGHVFSLRPVNRIGKLNYKISQRDSLKKLMVLAQHEVTHVQERWHDEDFARLRDEIAMNFDEAECLRRIKAALNQMPNLDSDSFDQRWAA